jgi:hypothetical protein
VINQSSTTPSHISSLSPMPTLHVAQDYHRSLPGVPRHSSRLPAQPQTMWSVLPKFRNEILLLYGCTNVRQINSLQIRTLYLLLEFLSTIGSVNGFNLSHVLLRFYESGMNLEDAVQYIDSITTSTRTCSPTCILCFGLVELQVPHENIGSLCRRIWAVYAAVYPLMPLRLIFRFKVRKGTSGLRPTTIVSFDCQDGFKNKYEMLIAVSSFYSWWMFMPCVTQPRMTSVDLVKYR